MKKKIFLIVSTVIICIAVVKLLPPTEEERIKKHIESLKDAVEEKDAIKTFSYIDQSYSDKNFVTSEDLKNGINDFFADFDSISVSMSDIKIRIDSSNAQKTIFASCSLGLKIFAEYKGEKVILYGGIIKPAPVKTYLKKSGKYYKIYYAEY